MKILSLIGVLSALWIGAPTLAAARTAAAASSDRGDGMAGRWGMGVVRFMDNGGENALSGTYWVMDRLAVDAYLGAGSLSTLAGGTDAAGNEANSSISRFTIGGAGRFDLARPIPALHM